MRKHYSTPEVEVFKATIQHMVATSPNSEEIDVGGETEEIEEIKEFVWE